MSALEDFNKLWDYSNPQATLDKFLALLSQPGASNDVSYRAQLMTQVARAMGLLGNFDDAHQTLNGVRGTINRNKGRAGVDLNLARVRYRLERGRLFNSAGKPAEAIPWFEKAWKLAEEANLPRYALDAVHMIAVAQPTPQAKVEWNLKGIAMVESDPSQRGWLSAFYNNLGEAYAALRDYEKGLDAFRRMAALDEEKGNPPEIYTLKDQSRMLRGLGRAGEAITLIKPVIDKLTANGKTDGWISEEYAECLLATGGDPAEARRQSAVAYELLSKDPWVVQHDRGKLTRLKSLAESA